jgi:hypothetical protein
MSDPIYIDDSYTRRKLISARPGLHGAAEVVYRVADPKKRSEYRIALDAKDADRLDKFEIDLLQKHVITINGSPLKPRLESNLRSAILDLILSYTEADAETDAGNSSGASA